MGFDVPMAYVDVYDPNLGYGTNFRLGRYISLPDIEAQLAPDNYFFSHSILYSFDPYTRSVWSRPRSSMRRVSGSSSTAFPPATT